MRGTGTSSLCRKDSAVSLTHQPLCVLAHLLDDVGLVLFIQHAKYIGVKH